LPLTMILRLRRFVGVDMQLLARQQHHVAAVEPQQRGSKAAIEREEWQAEAGWNRSQN
jgi:hypothetical protein